MDEFVKKLKTLREKMRKESPLHPFLPTEPVLPEDEESESESDLKITHYGRENPSEEGPASRPSELSDSEKSEPEDEISLEAPGFRELSLSDLGGTQETSDPSEGEKKKYIELIKSLLVKKFYDQAIEEIQELKRKGL